ncbi:YajG family lipoprotein [Plesiomonas sp.]|uniref:YajG family lipoprotein n=1 Tax=Plesiomonas sp. TaxID=2486279 RepID=UPI003F2FE918
MLKKVILPLIAVATLAGCINQPTNSIAVNPQITLPQQDPTLMGATISVSSSDQRPQPYLAMVRRSEGKPEPLYASRDIRFLLQETLEKQMQKRGYMLGDNGKASLQIIPVEVYADVQEGNLRHNITTKAKVKVITRTSKGEMIKEFRASYTVQGPLGAKNEDISKAINEVLTSVITDMAQDDSINTYIRQSA